MWPWCILSYCTWKCPALNENIVLLDFTSYILFFIKYLMITSLEYDGSFCFEVWKENGIASHRLQYWDASHRIQYWDASHRIQYWDASHRLQYWDA